MKYKVSAVFKKKLFAFMLGIFFLNISRAAIVDSPQLRCISVNSLNGVDLSWIVPADPSSSFLSYHIFRSATGAGPFLEIDTIYSYNQNTYTDNTVNASNTSYYYYVVTKFDNSGPQTSMPSDTLRSIRLNLTNPSNGTALITWNKPHDPLLSSGYFKIYYEYPLGTGTWILKDSTLNTTYTFVASICKAFMKFKIELPDNLSSCSSVSSLKGDTLYDETVPSIPVIDSVSVDGPSGRAFVGWNINPSMDTKGYYIYLKNNSGSWTLIDTVYGRLTSGKLIDPVSWSNASTQKETYRVAAFDSCMNASPMGGFHNSVFLQVDNDPCSGVNVLRWNPYINWLNSVSRYQVLVRINGRLPVEIGEVTSDTIFYHSDTYSDTTYCYYIRAFNGDSTYSAVSNRSCITPEVKRVPQFAVIRSVSVTGSNEITLTGFLDSIAQTGSYLVMVSEDQITYDTLSVLVPPFSSLYVLKYLEADPTKKEYYFKISGTDNCGNPLVHSLVSKASLLKTESDMELYNTLNWTAYEGWGNIEEYQVFRWRMGLSDTTLIANLDGAQQSYVDDVQLLAEGPGMFCYQIQAVKSIETSWPVNEYSFSNISCVRQIPRLYVPSAFTPDGDGLNDVFNVKNIFSDAAQYSLIIYNKKGQKIFESQSPLVGWDGSFRGDIVMQGAYPYYISIVSGSGEKFYKTGSVTVLR